MTGNSASFNLTTRPWILARYLDGEVRECSIETVLLEAHDIAEIVGELPTQTFAITRLLLAVLHRAVEGPIDDEHWRALWDAPALPAAEIRAYLTKYADRFDLLHPTAPFYQVAGLRTSRDEIFGLERLIADAPTGRPYLTTRRRRSLQSISLAEAARWVVHCQAFDPSGIKSGAVGDYRVKGGRGYPIGIAWAGAIGGVMAAGGDLRETLLLNAIAEDYRGLSASAADLPVWERTVQGVSEEVPDGRDPYGALDLYTWQARRIRLAVTGDRVDGVLICNGDRLTPQNRQNLEPMSAWRRSANQEKQLGKPLVYMPRVHDPDRALWQGIAALLPSAAAATQAAEAPRLLAPAVLLWAGELERKKLLPPDYAIRTRAIGMDYINNMSVVGDLIDDSLSIQAVLLSQDSKVLAEQVVQAADDAERGTLLLADLGGSLALAAGGDAEGPRSNARAWAFAALDGPFRAWLSTINSTSEPTACRDRWNGTARQILREIGGQLVRSASAQAWVGRKQQGRFYNTPTAESSFQMKLSVLFPSLGASDREEAMS